ncbi:MAG TPA: HIT family protein [Oceanicaulis sp.]|jgi:histidine triad (HIT) family protein|uniref:Hydrolase n=1 Tax=Glycocaulis albus TaxID=1382801 RepID=A0ABQ1XSK1_9PROT|nr:HIT family protein [Glycocaulis albus]GGH01620.1 hydrolase [Glycocaulis albus]HCY55125.1 HIT family protein [Oceanicaulis sp.]
MSLDGRYDDQNIFAKILRGEAPSVKVHEDAHTLAIMDVFPQAPGHVLVIPKEPARNLFELSEEAAEKSILAVKTVAAAVRRALEPDGVFVAQFNGAPAGQTVFHIHFHIIPRREGEEIAGHGKAKMADMPELEALAEKIRAAM